MVLRECRSICGVRAFQPSGIMIPSRLDTWAPTSRIREASSLKLTPMLPSSLKSSCRADFATCGMASVLSFVPLGRAYDLHPVILPGAIDHQGIPADLRRGEGQQLLIYAIPQAARMMNRFLAFSFGNTSRWFKAFRISSEGRAYIFLTGVVVISDSPNPGLLCK